MKRKLSMLLLVLAANLSLFAQSSIENLSEGSSISHKVPANRRVGQTFNTGSSSGELVSIEVKFTSEGFNGGLLTIDLYELNSNSLTLIASSAKSGYYAAKSNVRAFSPGVMLKPNTQYAFICRNDGLNMFNVVSSTADPYKGGNAFVSTTPGNDPQNVNYNPENGSDIYFRVLIREDELTGWFRLKTQFRGDGECLEGNAPTSNVHGGAAFMDKVQNVTGQLWRFEKQANGYYRLKTQSNGDNLCLEGNQAGSSVHNGAAFMDKCQNVSGQYWKVTKEGQYYRLETQFRGAGECLEGNQSASDAHNGSSFMDKRQNVSGQLWKLEKVK